MFFDFNDERSVERQTANAPETVDDIRARSARTVGIVYCLMAIGCAFAALGFHHLGPSLGVPPHDSQVVASAFSAIGAVNLVLLTGWETVFGVAQS